VRRLLAFALVLLAVAPAAACPRTSLSDVSDEVMCPVCGTSLSVATESPQADRERRFIQRLIDGCRSKDQIKATLAAQYGDAVLAVPKSKGFNISAVLIPALVLLATLALILGALIRWRHRPKFKNPTSPPRLDPEEQDRLERDMERYR
jgi:cytochrome c-type biogenesis protein CcmH/NrfF